MKNLLKKSTLFIIAIADSVYQPFSGLHHLAPSHRHFGRRRCVDIVGLHSNGGH